MRWLLFYLMTISFPLLGQQRDIYPDVYSTYFNNLALINPAFISKEGKVDLLASYKNRTGPFSKIATYSFTAGRIFRKENKSAHNARIIFFNEREGPFIGKPTAYVNYAYRLPISENVSLSAGLALGFAQVSFSAPSASGSGTATLPDGSLGLMLNTKKLNLGVSSMQMLNSGSEETNVSIRLRRFYNFFLSAEKNVSSQWKIKGYVLWRLLPSLEDNADASMLFMYKDIFSFGSSAKYRQGLSFFVTFNLKAGKDRILLSFAYNSPLLSKNNILLNSFELATGYIVN